MTVSPTLMSGEFTFDDDFRDFIWSAWSWESLRVRLDPVSWLREVCISNAEIPFLLRIVLVAIVALAKVAWSILSPSGASFLISVSTS